ncbi:MAG: MAPEG family protein [Bacteriovoracaceae bacterium]|nr:MAPEG family protein [Bacteriovoracaceae bacterium]
MEIVTIIVCVALLEYVFFSIKVGSMRSKLGVKAPFVAGNEKWERYYRVQQNTIEQYIVFIPSIYGFAYYINPLWASGIGALVLIGRFLYYVGYTNPEKSRGTGFILTFVPSMVLLLGTLVGCIIKLV